MKKLLPTIVAFLAFINGFSKGIDEKDFSLGRPHRIIRTCCAFGDKVGFMGVPFIKISDIIALDDIGTHHYLGGKTEKNGILYTYKGGFIDTGHLRDQADWTAYLHSLIMHNLGNKNFELMLGHEGGEKKLKLSIPKNFSNKDAALLAGRITYDLAVWHEIATWYGASSVPLVPERYSSFSAEDDYSNQLGASLGIQAILSDEPFDTAMAHLLSKKLDELKAVQTIEESYRAMDMVNGKWWSRDYDFPSKYFLLQHEISNYKTTYPLLVPEITTTPVKPEPIEITKVTIENIPLNKYYSLEFDLNGKIPYTKIFHKKRSKKVITNADFALLLENIQKETQLLKYRKFKRKTGRKNLWGEI